MPSQSCFSTNWNSADAVSKCLISRIETAKVTIVVHSAIQRDVPRAIGELPRAISAMRIAPSSGRKVTTERIGQVICRNPSVHREHEPGDDRRRADEHGEGVVIEVTALEPHDVARDIEHPRGDAVRAEAVDQPAVAALPERVAEPLRRTHENEVVEFVEVPFVEQELVERPVLPGELARYDRTAKVEMPGDEEADQQGARGDGAH